MLGIQASSALGWLILEMMVFTGSTYIIQTDLKVFDLLAFCTYKFVGLEFEILSLVEVFNTCTMFRMIFILVIAIFGGKTGYYSALLYSSLSLAVFLVI